jgi:transcriptional regulator with XRE-family HTH domain
MNIEELRDDVRAYLRAKKGQEQIAAQIPVSYSWLNKFINGQFPNLSPKRLQKLAEWVERDRARAECGEGRRADVHHAGTIAEQL